MMTLEDIKQELRKYNLSKVAREAGVDRHVIYRLVSEDSKPQYDTVKKLSDYLSGDDQE